MNMKDTTGTPDSTETAGAVDLHTAGGRRGPTWRGWIISILAAIILSVTATLLLGGSGAFRSDRATAGSGDCGSGAGGNPCPHSTVGK
jgi:hypothetical protein